MSHSRPVILTFLLSVIFLSGCTQKEVADKINEVENPPAEGFNYENSDPEAIAIADNVMLAMGGRESWDQTHYLCWNFFGNRTLIWDKWTGDVRIDSHSDSVQYLLNIHSMEGRVMVKGVEITDTDSLQKLVDRGKQIWINDSYWLVMPYKLKDSGVTLKYLREDTTAIGIESDVLGLTFENVGVTPENHYEVWVDKETSMVQQWAYYRNDTVSAPNMLTPWDDWEQHGDIMLSGNRGDGRLLSDIIVLNDCPENTFTSFDPVDLIGSH